MIWKTAKLDKNRQVIIITFPMKDTTSLNNISRLANVHIRYDGNWEVPVSKEVIALLKKWDFELSNGLLDWREDAVLPVSHKKEIPRLKNGLTLYDYQKQGVRFIQEKAGRALIADEMGLGKTVQALAWMDINPKIRPVLIICPSSLKLNWEREALKWVHGAEVTVLEGRTPYKFKQTNIVIINYEIVHDWRHTLKKYQFECMVVDEVHYTKSPSAQRTKAVKLLNKYIPRIVALSGTPIENRPVELYNIISMIQPDLFPNYYSYLHRFCGARRNIYGGLDTTGATDTLELNRILKQTIMIRRKKADVLKELPSKQIVTVPIQIDNRPEYLKAENEFIKFIQDRYGANLNDDLKQELKNFAKRHKIETSDDLSEIEIQNLKELKIEKVGAAPVLAQIEHLKQIAVEGKLKEIINWVETFLETGEKLVLFAIHKKIVNALMKHFPKAVKIDGSVSGVNRQKAVDSFQKDPNVQLMIANIKAGGVGLTLTAASNVAITQLPWSPSVLNQAIDRVHRITQVHQVTAWILVGQNTIEEKILSLLKEKESVVSEVLDGETYQDISVFMSLVNSYRKIKK
jgi:SWI/SNF-related matrix-associated actin-dependent regulator 1 of chromatin subfamily A